MLSSVRDYWCVLMQDKAFFIHFQSLVCPLLHWYHKQKISKSSQPVFCATIIHSEVKPSPWSSLELSLTLWINSQYPFNHSRGDFTVVQPQNCLPMSLFHFLSHTQTRTHAHTHTHTHTHTYTSLFSSPSLITHHWLLHVGWCCYSFLCCCFFFPLPAG